MSKEIEIDPTYPEFMYATLHDVDRGSFEQSRIRILKNTTIQDIVDKISSLHPIKDELKDEYKRIIYLTHNKHRVDPSNYEQTIYEFLGPGRLANIGPFGEEPFFYKVNYYKQTQGGSLRRKKKRKSTKRRKATKRRSIKRKSIKRKSTKRKSNKKTRRRRY